MRAQKIHFIVVQVGTIVSIVMFAYFFHEGLFEQGGATAHYVAAYSEPLQEESSIGEFGKPTHLSIPSISVEAKVQLVGLTPSGSMGIPTNFTDVGWYKYGIVPGEVGSAVIDGHVDNALGLKGVFKYLKNVKIGEEVVVTDVKGNEHTFIVREVDSYRYDDAPTEDIFHESDRRLLRLITCGGKWIQSAKTYDTRVVVTAEYVSR